MQKWEYTQVTYLFNGHNNTGKVVIVHMTLTGKTSKNQEHANINGAIAQLGLEGWEMISVTETFFNGETVTIYYFKRAITTPASQRRANQPLRRYEQSIFPG